MTLFNVQDRANLIARTKSLSWDFRVINYPDKVIVYRKKELFLTIFKDTWNTRIEDWDLVNRLFDWGKGVEYNLHIFIGVVAGKYIAKLEPRREWPMFTCGGQHIDHHCVVCHVHLPKDSIQVPAYESTNGDMAFGHQRRGGQLVSEIAKHAAAHKIVRVCSKRCKAVLKGMDAKYVYPIRKVVGNAIGRGDCVHLWTSNWRAEQHDGDQNSARITCGKTCGLDCKVWNTIVRKAIQDESNNLYVTPTGWVELSPSTWSMPSDSLPLVEDPVEGPDTDVDNTDVDEPGVKYGLSGQLADLGLMWANSQLVVEERTDPDYSNMSLTELRADAEPKSQCLEQGTYLKWGAWIESELSGIKHHCGGFIPRTAAGKYRTCNPAIYWATTGMCRAKNWYVNKDGEEVVYIATYQV